MHSVTCTNHMTDKQKADEDKRSLREKRNFMQMGDVVVVTKEYKKFMSTKSEFNGGKIVEFSEPSCYNKTESSTALLEMPCGCKKIISTGWLTRKRM